MKYTIISKSGLEGDTWQIKKTFSSYKEAKNFKENEKSHDARSTFFFIRIMRHKKDLSDLSDFESAITIFSNGTKAYNR